MPSVAIIGAGPAGLTLARLLLVQARDQRIPDLQLKIFEHDASPTARWQQGGTLDLHPSTGIAALKAAKMWDDILPHMRYDGEELIIADMNATSMVHLQSASQGDMPGAADERPEVDREILKQYLLKAVQDMAGADIVTWGKHLASAEGETGILKFKDGSEAGPFDLVVGADGAWSKIRNVLTPDVCPTYSGICGFESWVDEEHSGDLWPQFNKFVGKGSFFSFTDGRSIMAQRMENGSLKMAMWVKKEATWPADIVARCGGDADKIRDALLEEFSEWDEQIKQLIRCSWHWREWPLYELPVGHSWEHKKGFTLIGDSAHLMTPFAGEGVNSAMKDALELADAIVSALKGKESLAEAVRKFELEEFLRNAKVQAQTARNKNIMFRSDAPAGFMSEFMFEQVGEYAEQHGYNTQGWVSWALAPAKKLAFLYYWSISRYGYLRRCIRRT